MTINELAAMINGIYLAAQQVSVTGQQNIHNMDFVLTNLAKLSGALRKTVEKSNSGGETDG